MNRDDFPAIDNNLIYQIDAIDNGQFPTIESNYKVYLMENFQEGLYVILM